MGSSRERVYDVVAAGGGPAGASAALELAKGGARVAVLEKASPPRQKICAGGLLHRVKRMLPLDIDEVIECPCRNRRVRRALFRNFGPWLINTLIDALGGKAPSDAFPSME